MKLTDNRYIRAYESMGFTELRSFERREILDTGNSRFSLTVARNVLHRKSAEIIRLRPHPLWFWE